MESESSGDRHTTVSNRDYLSGDNPGTPNQGTASLTPANVHPGDQDCPHNYRDLEWVEVHGCSEERCRECGAIVENECF
jgi:hypothetical protein